MAEVRMALNEVNVVPPIDNAPAKNRGLEFTRVFTDGKIVGMEAIADPDRLRHIDLAVPND